MTCPGCGEEFQQKNPKRPTKTCSRACASRVGYRAAPDRKGGPKPQPRTVVDCLVCGKPVKWADRPHIQARMKYCSRECAGRSSSKGGLSLGKDGRWRVRTRDYSKQLYSRAVMEGILCRHLEYNEVVHHINGDVGDDRPENLMVMTRSEHTSMHSRAWWDARQSLFEGAEVTCWLAQFSAAPCDGPLVRAHLIPKQLLRREHLPDSYRVCVPACGGVMGNAGHHGMLDHSRTLRVPRAALPTDVEEFAAEHGITYWLDREYGLADDGG